MTLKELKIEQNKIRTSLAKLDVISAIALVRTLVTEAGDWQARQRLDDVATSYNYMLQYFAQGSNDPGREQVLATTMAALYEITDRCVVRLSEPQSFELFYTRRAGDSNSLTEIIASYRSDMKKIAMLSGFESNHAVVAEIKSRLERAEVTIFNIIWTIYPMTDDDFNLLQSVLDDEQIPTHLKCLILSALLLGITKFYDEPKFLLFCDTYAKTAETDLTVAARALIGVVLTLFIYRSSIRWQSVVGEKLEQLSLLPHWHNDVRNACIRLARTRNTENITRLMQENIMPDIKKLSPEMIKNIRQGKMPENALYELEENPEWKHWLKESGVEDKLRELNDLQLNGDDVHISTFSHLKSFPFFNTIANWFLPFHVNHSSIADHNNDAGRRLATTLQDLSIMCNSDKYSIFFSIMIMPRVEQTMVIEQFSQQRDALREHENAEQFVEIQKRDIEINTYIKDLYRFFKLFSRREEFYQVFNSRFSVINTPYLKDYAGDTQTLATLAEFYFTHRFYCDAIEHFEHLLIATSNADTRYYQKIGYAYQCLGEYRKAITAYEKYELVQDDDVWTLRQKAACYRALNLNSQAIDLYKRALEIKPDAVPVMLNYARTLLDNGEVASALKVYFKVDYLDVNRHRAWRPIAWCSMLEHNYVQSKSYYQKIFDNETPIANDYLNYGHLMLITGEIQSAIANYRLALKALGDDRTKLEALIGDDTPMLRNQGVDETVIALASQSVIATP